METSLAMMVVRAGPLLGHVRQGVAPVAVWDFSSGFYTRAWSLQRSGVATWFSANGGLETAAQNQPRLIGAGAGRYLLAEAAGTNRCAPAVTTAVNLGAVVPGDVIGGIAFQRITDDGDGFLQFDENSIAGLAPGSPVTFSCVLRAGTAAVVQLWVGIGTTGTSRVRFEYNLATGAVTPKGNPDGLLAQGDLVNLGGGNFRASVTGAIVSPEGNELNRFFGVNGTLQYAFPQFEASSAASSVITAAGGARAADQLVFDVPDGSYTAVVGHLGAPPQELPITVSGGAWQPAALVGKIQSVALY